MSITTTPQPRNSQLHVTSQHSTLLPLLSRNTYIPQVSPPGISLTCLMGHLSYLVKGMQTLQGSVARWVPWHSAGEADSWMAGRRPSG